MVNINVEIEVSEGYVRIFSRTASQELFSLPRHLFSTKEGADQMAEVLGRQVSRMCALVDGGYHGPDMMQARV